LGLGFSPSAAAAGLSDTVFPQGLGDCIIGGLGRI
jgi:hypothetical protein